MDSELEIQVLRASRFWKAEDLKAENLLLYNLSYKPLTGKDGFDEVFNKPDNRLNSKHFRALILSNGFEFRLGMILPKKHIRLAVHRNYIKRTIRNLSNDIFIESKTSLIVVSKRKILDFEKDILRTEIKTLLTNILNKWKG